jgi:hypothetical protein
MNWGSFKEYWHFFYPTNPNRQTEQAERLINKANHMTTPSSNSPSFFAGLAYQCKQQCLNFLPLPQTQGSLRFG